MLELLPPFLRGYSEIKEIMNVENVEIETIAKTHNQIVDNRYIHTCDESGIERFEKMLKIIPLSNDTLDDRKLRCMTKWNQKLPYNYAVLSDKLSDICGEDGYELNMDFQNLHLGIKIALGVKNQFSSVEKMVDAMIPCNVVTNIELMYNTYDMLIDHTHEQLSSHTHLQLREVLI